MLNIKQRNNKRTAFRKLSLIYAQKIILDLISYSPYYSYKFIRTDMNHLFFYLNEYLNTIEN